MPRKITSLDPRVVPATPETSYDEMLVTMFRIIRHPDGSLAMRANLEPADSEGNLDQTDAGFRVNIRDLTSQMAVTPKFAKAWDDIVDVMGLAYDFYRIKEKVQAAEAAGEDTTDLVAARVAALAALRAPV
jgi:hypothetical protein